MHCPHCNSTEVVERVTVGNSREMRCKACSLIFVVRPEPGLAGKAAMPDEGRLSDERTDGVMGSLSPEAKQLIEASLFEVDAEIQSLAGELAAVIAERNRLAAEFTALQQGGAVQ